MSKFDDLIDNDSDDYSENDTFARRNLEDHFTARNWRIITGRNPNSGREEGRDWIITVKSEKGGLRGFEFNVQSKALSSKDKLKKRHIWDRVSVKTIKYLMELPGRAAFHFYDRRAETGYIRWVDEWINSKDCGKNWDKQEDVVVKIYRIDELNDQRVAVFRSRLFEEAKLLEMVREAQLINSRNSNYRATIIPGQTPELQIIPLRKEASPQIYLDPRDLQAAMKSTVHRIEYPFQVQNFPELSQVGSGEVVDAFIYFPKGNWDAEFHLRIEFLDEGNNVLLKCPVVPFQSYILGNDLEVKRGFDKKHLLHFFIEKEAKNLKVILGFEHQKLFIQDPEKVIWLEALLNKMACTKALKFTNLENDSISVVPFSPNIEPNENNELIFSLAHALIEIKRVTNINISIPNKFSLDDLRLAQELTSIFATGKLPRIAGLAPSLLKEAAIGKLIAEIPESEAIRLRDELLRDNELEWSGIERYVTLLGHEIDLGLSTDHFINAEVESIDPVVGPNLSEATSPSVRFAMLFNLELSYTTFDSYFKAVKF